MATFDNIVAIQATVDEVRIRALREETMTFDTLSLLV
jgi:hypothetical protein